jgi:hypothetical protein
MNEESPQGEVKSFSSPRLSPEEKLYVRVYLSTLSHAKAYEALKPGLVAYTQYSPDNQFSRRENVKFHISLGLQDKAETLSLSPELILEKLWKEATREGSGSNHAARIQALTQLGKHLGLFEEKKENNSHTFNIINYSPSTPLEKIEPIQISEDLSEDLPSDIHFTTYESTDPSE